MDTLNWTSRDGRTCDQLDMCDISTEKPKDGADLVAVGNDPARNCCACGKRFQGLQKASTIGSPNGTFCQSSRRKGITCLAAPRSSLDLVNTDTSLAALDQLGELEKKFVSDRFAALEPISDAGYWMFGVVAILAILTLFKFFRKPATKFTEDDFIRAELLDYNDSDAKVCLLYTSDAADE